MQPRGPFDGIRIVTPDHSWQFADHNGLSQIDATTGVAFASLVGPGLVRDVALSRDGRDVYLFVDARPHIDDGAIESRLTRESVLERWNLASGTRRWSRPIPGGEGGPRKEHVVVGASGVWVTRCIEGRDASCTVFEVEPETGAMRERATTPLRFALGHWQTRVESASGRFTLRGARWEEHMREMPRWTVIDDRGVLRATVRAGCARFDRDDVLWLDRATTGELATVRALGIELREGTKACVPPMAKFRALPFDSSQKGIDDLANLVVTETHIAWSPAATHGVFAIATGGASLPAALVVPGGPWELRGDSRLLLTAGTRMLEISDVGDLPREAKLPRDAFVWRDGEDLLAGWFTDGYTTAHAIATRLPNGSLRWRSIDAPSAPRFPGFTVSERGGRRTVVVAGGRYGLQFADAATGRLLERICTTPKLPTGTCSAEQVFGLLANPDGRTAWTHRSAYPNGRSKNTFDEIELATGRVVRSIPAAGLSSTTTGYTLRWLEPGRRFWLASPNDRTTGQCITVVSLGDEVTHEQHCFDGRSASVDPQGRFMIGFRPLDTIDVYRLDGTRALTTAIRGDDALALTPDGRFACTGAACEDLRCIVKDEARPVTDPACASLRVPGFSVLAETR